MRSLKPICVPCHRFYRPEKNGFTFLEGMPKGQEDRRTIQPGLIEPENWEPYKLWRGDLWKCHGCGHLLIEGVGASHITEHYLPDFKQIVEEWATKDDLGNVFQVNDC